jgi:class 3 adenylate cyclase/tetratricopeptide (TPR) repeat protein
MASTGKHQLTILFTDVQGSTQLRSRRGDQVADEILRAHEAVVRHQITAHDGQEVAFLGDGFMAAFASASDGLACAIAIQQELEARGRSDPDNQVRIRIGLHHGEAVERDGTLYGKAVHAAARVEAEAVGGQILVSSTVRELSHGKVDAAFVDRGLFWLKGFPERWRLYEVLWGSQAVARPAGTMEVTRTPLVERDRERADLRRAMDRARRGRGSLVLVSGDAGVGKTRLLREIGAEADLRGVRVLTGHCVKMEGHAPYLPFAEMIEQAMVAQRSPAAFRQALGDAAPEIARIAPGLRLVVHDIPPALELAPEQARRYLWLSVQEFIERAAGDRPLLLVLEDLHWADESTLLLLEYLAPHLAQMAVLMAGTYRDTEVGPSHLLTRTMGELVRGRLVTRIALKPLSADGIAAMVRGLSGHQPPEGLVRAVHTQSEGNPFFAEEIFLHLAESGVILDERGRFRDDLRIEELDVPESVRLVIGERLARLSEATRQVLAAAALSGRVFETEVVAQVVEADHGTNQGDDKSPDLGDALDEAERAHLIGPHSGDESSMAFAHELIRQALLIDLSAFRRQRLHQRTAEAIEGVHAADLDAHAADLAYHLSRSGPGTDTAKLAGYLRTAGDRAMQAAAFQEAADHFEYAVSLLPERERDARAELLERQAMALRSLGRWNEALHAMDQAVELYQALGRKEALGRLYGVMAYQLGWNARWQEAFAVATRGLGALGNLPSPDRARLLAAAAWVIGLGGDYAGATGMLDRARNLAEDLADDSALADVLHLETIHHLGYAQFAAGIASGMRAAEVFEAEGALWDLTSALAFVEYLVGTLTRRDPAWPETGRAEPMAERLGHLGALFLTVADRARYDGVFQADLATIEELGRRQVEICARGGLPWLYVGHLYLGLAAHWRGDWDQAEQELRTAEQLEAPGAIGGQSAAHLALHLAVAGRKDEVLAIVESRRQWLPAAGRVNAIGPWNMLFGFTEALYLVGEREQAAGFLPLILAALDMGDDWVTFDGRTARSRAAIAAAAGRRWDEAAGYFRAALETAEALGNRIEQADLRQLEARMLLDRDGPGDREQARALLEDATGRYRAMGMPRHADLAAALA